jgi:hypothetical protein
MGNTTQLSCAIGTTNALAALGIEIWLDAEQIFNSDHVTDTTDFTHEFLESDGEHELRFIMKNKTEKDTAINEAGDIVSDARLIVSDLSFDEIELGQILLENSVYTHTFNGTQPETQDKFYGEMGCNGTVSLKFTTPIYLWLLENM